MESEGQGQWFSTQAEHYNYLGALKNVVAQALHQEIFWFN